MVGSEVGRVRVILDGACFGIVAAVDIDSNEVIGEDAFENADIVGDDGLGPVRLSLSYVGSVGRVVVGRLDLRQGRDEQKKRYDHEAPCWHEQLLSGSEWDFSMGLDGGRLGSFLQNARIFVGS